MTSRYEPRYKQAQKNGTPEVFYARSKLDGLLQTLVEKKEESPTLPEVEKEEEPDEVEPARDSVPNTPTKRGSSASAGKSSSKKRRRGKDDISGPEMGQYHHTYVMKLFDRSVDLAQFDEDTPLYPICRAWMRNQPHNRNLAPRDRSPSPEPKPDDDEDSDTEMRDVYRLPSPVDVKLEPDQRNRDLRIPSPSHQPDDHLDLYADPDTAPPPEQLLLNHMDRWKTTRQKWREAGIRSEAKYAPAMKILRDMFDQQTANDN